MSKFNNYDEMIGNIIDDGIDMCIDRKIASRLKRDAESFIRNARGYDGYDRDLVNEGVDVASELCDFIEEVLSIEQYIKKPLETISDEFIDLHDVINFFINISDKKFIMFSGSQEEHDEFIEWFSETFKNGGNGEYTIYSYFKWRRSEGPLKIIAAVNNDSDIAAIKLVWDKHILRL